MTCEANPAGKNNSFIFTVCMKSVPLYRFKRSYVVSTTYGCQRIFRNPLLQMEKQAVLILRFIFDQP